MTKTLSIVQEHQSMVTLLAKPGTIMCEEFTPSNHHLWHMAGALMSEVGELTEAVQHAIITDDMNKEDLLEEMGDISFYMEGIRQGLDIDYDVPDRTVPGKLESVDHVPSLHKAYRNQARQDRNLWLADLNQEIVIYGGRILDWAKRVVIYRKDMELELLSTYMGVFESGVELLGSYYGLTHEMALQHNINKLLKGKKARYGQGGYSDEQAVARADKNGPD